MVVLIRNYYDSERERLRKMWDSDTKAMGENAQTHYNARMNDSTSLKDYETLQRAHKAEKNNPNPS